MSATLYQALDTITGGLPAFMANGADETWRQEGCKPFSLTAMSADKLLFGFDAEINGDLVPDPIYNVKVDCRAKTANIVLVDTLLGHYQVNEGNREENTAEAVDLAAEMVRRRQAGSVEIKRVCY